MLTVYPGPVSANVYGPRPRWPTGHGEDGGHLEEARRPAARRRERRDPPEARHDPRDSRGPRREGGPDPHRGGRRPPGDEAGVGGPPAHAPDPDHRRGRGVRGEAGPGRRHVRGLRDVQDGGRDGGPLRGRGRAPHDLGHGEVPREGRGRPVPVDADRERPRRRKGERGGPAEAVVHRPVEVLIPPAVAVASVQPGTPPTWRPAFASPRPESPFRALAVPAFLTLVLVFLTLIAWAAGALDLF